jgi:hypothetical protein
MSTRCTVSPPKESAQEFSFSVRNFLSASAQGGGQTHWNFNVPYIICGTSIFLT